MFCFSKLKVRWEGTDLIRQSGGSCGDGGLQRLSGGVPDVGRLRHSSGRGCCPPTPRFPAAHPCAVTPTWEAHGMAFGQQSGPPASTKEVAQLEALLDEAGYSSFREARHIYGLTQRQATGKFTRPEATE